MEDKKVLRFKFKKYGPIVYIGHLDIMRFFQKAIRRSGIDAAYTEGFSPHLKLSFAQPLSVGVETDGDYFDLEMETLPDLNTLVSEMNKQCVDGIEILNVTLLNDDVQNGMSSVKAADYIYSFESLLGEKELLDKFFSQETYIFEYVRKEDNIVYLVFENKELIDIEFEKENELPVGTKCVGKVSKIAKDINSAFILLPDKSTAYLKNIPADLKCEQNIAVEITRASSKGKLPSVTLINEYIEHRTDLSIIEKGPKTYEKLLLKYKFDRILTDIDNILKEIKEFINSNNVIDLSELILYNDLMVSLSTLYSVSARLKEATSKVIWLKSGANIVIEETSAFTVIDVNSAKKDNKKSNSYLEINKEAAAEIFRQMNLRNLSGIILIDFINLEREEYKILMDELNNLAKTQKSFTKVVDITALGIAEITRKKEGITLSDIVK